MPAHPLKPSLGVYPRTHGEANRPMEGRRTISGLSPHTRGSRRRPVVGEGPDGSIPAHTGKPGAIGRFARALRVYPRTHGEATATEYSNRTVRGLSPHTRGSRPRRGPGRPISGSIPAHTGKPEHGDQLRKVARVYPRTHGEADRIGNQFAARQGLSPHTRGSHERQYQRIGRTGSIPAHTGKPPGNPVGIRPYGVYPRTHGEAGRSARHLQARDGLSPHTRGSPSPSRGWKLSSGSIPAHTGKPGQTRGCCEVRTVYPRTHGEAP